MSNVIRLRGCELCEDGDTLTQIKNEICCVTNIEGRNMFIEIDEHELATIRIAYCPWCGKKLEA